MRLVEFESVDINKLDDYLSKLCSMIKKGQAERPEYYGMVAAGILTPKGRWVAKINYPKGSKRVHAERAAIEEYQKYHGKIPKGSILITTLSPCNEKDDVTAADRVGVSCTDLINQQGFESVYSGYKDPTQDNEHGDYKEVVTKNKQLHNMCKQFADTFLDKINEVQFGGQEVEGNSWAQLKEKFPNLSTLLYFIPGLGQALVVADVASQIQMYNQAIDKIEKQYPTQTIQTVQQKVGDAGEAWETLEENFDDDISEARSHPEQNTKYQTGWAELGAWADKNNVWLKPHQWAISMTYMPKLGTNPGQGISEDTPRGIYFYPFHWAYSVKKDKEALPWADNAPYIQLFQYSTGAGLREPNQIPLASAVAELKKYGITDQDIAAEKENDPSISTYRLLVWCLGRKFDDNRRVSILNKVLRNLGYDYMIDNGKGWIAINEPTQGVVLNPEIINKVVTFNNYTRKKEQGVAENFADGRNPQDKGDSARLGIPKHASISSLRKMGHGSGRKAQLARWQANMRSGRNK